MIFVGDGALLQQAVESAFARGYRVDGVFGNTDRLRSFCAQHGLPFAPARELDVDPSRVRSMCSDGVGFSIDNSMLLPASFLESVGVAFFGIHSGIIPIQRGNPVVASIFAILDGSDEYGITLYKLDAAVDAGEILATERFAISPQMRLHELILKCSDLCQQMFDDHVDSIVRRTYRGTPAALGTSRPFTLRDLDRLSDYRDHEEFDRATDLGFLDGVLPRRCVDQIDRLRSHRGLNPTGSGSDTFGHRGRSIAFWLGRLADVPALHLPALATGAPRARAGAASRRCHSFALEPYTTRDLRAWSASLGFEPREVLFTCLFALLARYSGSRDVCIGTATPPASARTPSRSLPIRVHLSGDPGLGEAVVSVREQCAVAESHAEGLTDETVARLCLGGSGRPFDVDFIDMDTGARPDRPDGPERPDSSWQVALSWTCRVSADAIELSIDHDAARFDEAFITRLSRHYCQLLAQALARPADSVFSLQLLTGDEVDEIHKDWSHVDADRSEGLSVAQLIERRAAQVPASVALIDRQGHLRYSELNWRSNQLARFVKTLAQPPETRVAICLEPGRDVIVAMLGAWRAGCAFVPIDPALPRERIRWMLVDAAVSAVVSQRTTNRHLPEGDWRSVVLDEPEIAGRIDGYDGSDLAWDGAAGDVAYVIYTSGSTGTPKGVIVEHGSLLTAFAATQLAHALTRDDRFLGLACFGSDAAVWQLLAPLCWGACVVMTQGSSDPSQILTCIDRHAVTVVDLVPSLLSALLSELDRREADLPSLRTVVCGGEELPFTLRQHVASSLPLPDLFNAYGPTEASCQVTFHRCGPDEPVTIGEPIAHTQLYVLSPERAPLPVGVTGEIYIGGATLARGYLNNPALTRERFTPDPFAPDAEARMYRTGDLGRRLPNGEIEFLGRLDHQVKLRGHRVELGEIENALRQYPEVTDAVVLLDEQTSPTPRLIAYVLTRAALSLARLRAHLEDRLPSHMLPAAVVPLSSWPLTRHQKIDRSALSSIGAEMLYFSSERVPPRTDLERALAALWSGLLGVPEVGIRDRFVDLGGHSLLAVRLIHEIRAQLGVELSLRSIGELATVEGIAAFISSGCWRRPRSQRPATDTLLADASLPDDVRIRPGRAPAAEGDILVTGATGYLGRHLLRALLERTDERVHCLIRAPSDVAAAERIRRCLELAGLTSVADRVGVVRGDLALPRLGLPAPAWSLLSQSIGRIFHVGAAVNHLSSYGALREPNVRGTLELLRLAVADRVKEMHFVSSIDVVPRSGSPSPESMTIDVPPEHVEGYGGTKWVSDQLVAQAARRGLPARIYRVGYIGPHSRGIDANAAGWVELFLTAIFKLRSVPDDMLSPPLTPVDLVVDSIWQLASDRHQPHGAFHLVHREREITPETVVAAAANLGEELEIVPRKTWRDRLAAYCSNQPTDSASLLGPYLDETGEHGPPGERPLAPARCDLAAKVLAGLRDFDPVALMTGFFRAQAPVVDAGGEERRGA